MARILVVDDEPDMRLALKNVLVRDGHRVTEAGDGESALKHLEGTDADLVLLDIRLPGLDGVQTLRRIREMRRELPVIMITGYGSVDTAVEVAKLGADQYLQKPFDNQQLTSLVNKTLNLPVAAEDMGVLKRSLLSKVGGEPETEPAAASPAAAAQGEPRPRPAKASSGPRVVLLTAIAAAMLAVAVMVKFAPRPPDNRDYLLPSKNPSALTWTQDGLWVSDWYNETVTLLDTNLKPIRSIKLEGVHPIGMAVAGDHLYIADAWLKKIQKRKLDDKLTLEQSYPSPGPSPSGLFFDGKSLWSTDSEEGRIFQHDLKDLQVVRAYPSPAKAPVAIFKRGQALWSIDANTRKIYLHHLGPGLPVVAVYSLPALQDGREPLSTFTLHDRYFWLARDGKAVLHKRGESAFQIETLQ